MQHKGTDWNKHHGVGATLLENWVEERMVSADKIIDERKNWAALSKFGHSGILMHDKNLREIGTTSQAAFGAAGRADPNKMHMGKRRQMIEAELMRRAVEDLKDPPVDRSAREWKSTNHSDFSADVKLTLGLEPPPEELAGKYAHPITFWTDHATKGCGTAICSTRFEKPAAGAAGAAPVRFGKHAAFSTPIKEFKKAAVKDV